MLVPRLDENTNKWFLGPHEITAAYFGYHYILAGPNAKKFVSDMGDVLPFTFDHPQTFFNPTDHPNYFVNLNPRYYPTPETTELVFSWIKNAFREFEVILEHGVHEHPVPYFQFLNPDHNSDDDRLKGRHAAGLVAFNIMVNGFADTVRRLRAELQHTGIS